MSGAGDLSICELDGGDLIAESSHKRNIVRPSVIVTERIFNATRTQLAREPALPQ